MARLRYNGMATGSAGSQTDISLSGSHTNSTTTLTFNAALTYANGTAVPTLSGGDHFMLTILDSGGRVSEVVKVTAYTSGGTTATVTRGQEGTSGVSHASGDKVVHAGTTRDSGLVQFAWARRSSGDISLNSATYVDLDTGTDLVLNAAVGDVIEVTPQISWSGGSTYCVIDVVTVVSSSPVNSVVTGGAPSTSNSGGAWSLGATNRGVVAGPRMYTIQSGDLSSGTVRLRLRARGSAVTVFAASDPDLYWQAKNLGPQSQVK